MLLNSNNLYIHAPFLKLMENLDRFLTLNLNSEIYIDSHNLDNVSTDQIESLNKAFNKRGLSKTIHGPFMDLNPGSFDRSIRKATLERFLGALELSTKLNASSMVLHSHFEPIFYRDYFKEWVKNSEEVWEELCIEAEKKNTKIYIENSIDKSPGAIIALLQAHPYMGACFDVAHYNVFSTEGWEATIKEYPLGSIKEMHLSDNRGDEDSHLPLGKGTINFSKVFKEITSRNEEPIVTVEPHSPEDLEECLRFIRKFMNRELSS